MVRAVEAFVGRLEKAVAALPETGHGLIVGRDVTSTGADQSSLEPMVGQIVARTGCQPKTVLIEGGFYNRDSVTRLTRARMERLMPLRKPKRQDRTPDQPVHDDTPQWTALRRRTQETGICRRGATRSGIASGRAGSRGPTSAIATAAAGRFCCEAAPRCAPWPAALLP